MVYLAAPITYQLRYRQGDTFHHRFWGQLLRWAVARDLAEGSQTVRLSTDKSRYEQGEPVQVSVRLRQLDGKAVSGAAFQVSALQEGKVVQEITVSEDANRPARITAPWKSCRQARQLQVSGDLIKALLTARTIPPARSRRRSTSIRAACWNCVIRFAIFRCSAKSPMRAADDRATDRA